MLFYRILALTITLIWALCATLRHAPAHKPYRPTASMRRYAALADFGRVRLVLACEVRYA